MRYSKQATSFSEQVAQLKARGLQFQDENKAEETLSRISYYRLRAYTYPFQDNEDDNHPFIKEIDLFSSWMKYYLLKDSRGLIQLLLFPRRS